MQTLIANLPCGDLGLRSMNPLVQPANHPDPRTSEQMVRLVFGVGNWINPK
ncbi:MAG: hypothetical protein ACYC3X_03910 [Pirellulaceae bacterium]